MASRLLLPAFTALLLAIAAPAQAAPSDDQMNGIAAARVDYERAKRAIDRLNWKEAIVALENALRHDPRDAEFYNLLGFSHRGNGNMEAAFKHYFRALELNPSHRGAHEYIGRAYLMTNQPEKAVEHLDALEKQCPEVCKERELLKKAITEYPWPTEGGRLTRSY